MDHAQAQTKRHFRPEQLVGSFVADWYLSFARLQADGLGDWRLATRLLEAAALTSATERAADLVFDPHFKASWTRRSLMAP